MENLAGALGLGSLIKDGDEAKSVLFALLSSDAMVMDVLLKMIIFTRFIGAEEEMEAMDVKLQRDFDGDFTPDQTGSVYIKAMQVGPFSVFDEFSTHEFGDSFFATVRRSKYVGLLGRRLFRLLARESKGTPDGRGLGKICRRILPVILESQVLEKALRRPVSAETAENLLELSDSVDSLERVMEVVQQVLIK
jgi:hypothetical protein